MTKISNMYDHKNREVLSSVYTKRYEKICIKQDTEFQRAFNVMKALQIMASERLVWVPRGFDIDSGICTDLFIYNEVKASLYYDFETHSCDVLVLRKDNNNVAVPSLLCRYVTYDTGTQSAQTWVKRNLQ